MRTFAGTCQVTHADADARSVIPVWRNVLAWLRAWRSRVRAVHEIQRLTDRQLRDIGLTRLQAEEHAVQAFRPLILGKTGSETIFRM